MKTQSGGLPELDPIALGIGDPAESTDVLYVLRLLSDVRFLGAQLCEHRVQVADPKVDHYLLGTGPEVVGLGLERREHRWAGFLMPQAVLIGVQAQAIAIPRGQGRRVSCPYEVAADSKHAFHVAILAGRSWHHAIARFTPSQSPHFVPAYSVAVRRASLLLPAIALATVLLAVSAGVALGAGPEQGTVVRVKLELEANNGLHAHLESSEDGTVTLEMRKEGQVATYEVPGEATEGGLKARFGRLGLIDVAFTPTKTLSSTEPGKGCTGAPRTLREGVFTGTIDFTGEREFVRIEGTQATGSMSVISQWECPEAEAMDPFARVSRLLTASFRDEKGERESATLAAVRRDFSSYFVAGVAHRHSGGKSIFLGVKIEIREGMDIWRATEVRGPASAFDFDHAAGTAALRPPAPFSRHASFAARPHGRGLWRSTIRVPLLGANPIDTGGPGFRATLRPEYQF
jgi:hypothetical protein